MSITIFTSITANYLPKARVLARSVKKFHPEVTFSLLLAETSPLEFTADFSDFDEVTLLDDLNIANLPAWLFKHGVVELCTAIKGFYLEQLLHREGCKAVLYLDPDMVVFSPLESVFAEFESASILLTPHLLEAETKDEDIITNELSALKHGVYNLGFLGVKNSEEGRRFAKWWKDRLDKFCYADIPNGMFTDQRWVDLAPAFFEDLTILRHPGFNVATWNLNHRQIEGDMENGFRVNSKPLVFYHFSGFDSGSQLGMLERYASEMPAAFSLREWYINECTKQTIEASEQPWKYNCFTDGTPITMEQRKFYRAHNEVAARFPDPFSAKDGGFLDWYSFYGKDYVSPAPAAPNQNPLAHFLQSGWQQGISPHKAFDSRFYLENNPDVREQHFNPLCHYLHLGGKERRNPHPFFDTGFYLRRHGKQVNESGVTPLEYALAHEEQNIALAYYDAVRDADRVQCFKKQLRANHPTILLINHNQGGGTEKHVYDLPQLLGDKANFLLLYPVSKYAVRLANFAREGAVDLVFDWRTDLQVLVALLKKFRLSRLHIHHLMGNESYLQALIAAMQLPYDITLHDYYLLSPHPHLTDTAGKFTGEPLVHDDWRQQHGWLIENASRVIAPSNDIAARHQHYFPLASYIIAPHPSHFPYNPHAVTTPVLHADEKLRVAVLGLLSPNKGSDVLDKTAKLAHEMKALVSFDLLGFTLTPLTVEPESSLQVHGKYEEEDLPGLLAQLKPHLVWFPALCPESFSYTLSSAMAAQLPVVVTDIGAFSERVNNRPWSWIMPWQTTAGEWLKFFSALREKSFVPLSPPEVPTGKEHSKREQFYREEYIIQL